MKRREVTSHERRLWKEATKRDKKFCEEAEEAKEETPGNSSPRRGEARRGALSDDELQLRPPP